MLFKPNISWHNFLVDYGRVFDLEGTISNNRNKDVLENDDYEVLHSDWEYKELYEERNISSW